MKIIKPQKLGLLTRTFENDGRAYVVVTAMAFFPFEAPDKLLHEVALWKMVTDQLGPNVPFDVGMTKQRGEVLAGGKAFAPGGAPVPAKSVRLKATSAAGRALVDKELYVVGDRQWEFSGPSDPVPFTEMPVDWTRAFGGEGFVTNPIGRGALPITIDGKKVHPLPNVEDPRRLVKSKGDKPAPAGFGPIDQTWPQRFKKVGTYDALWLKTRFPGFAADFDWSFFNTAPDDQQIEGYFTGDEAFEIHGMHPEHEVQRVTLPKVRARLFIVQKKDGGEVLREATARLDTVFLFPSIARGVALFRGALEIEEDDGNDVAHVIAAFERPDEPRTPEHYQAILEKRRDKKRGAFYALLDDDLIPRPEAEDVGPSVPEDDWNDMASVVKTEGFTQKRLEKKADREIAGMREQLVAAGVDPAEFDEKVKKRGEKPPESPQEMSALFDRAESEAEAARVKAAESLKELEEAARDDLTRLGVDYERAVAKAKAQQKGGPPKFSAEREIEWIRDMAELGRNAGMRNADAEAKLASAEFIATLREIEQRLLDAYRRFAHGFPAAEALGPDASQALRREIEAIHARGESLAGRDLTGADLAGIDLTGADLRGGLLETCNLAGAKLKGANLEGAVLARANLEGADLDGANVARANFGYASLKGAKLGGGLDFSGAVFYHADLAGASLRGGKLFQTQFLSTKLEGADLAEIVAEQAQFVEADLSRADLSGATLKDAVFLKSKLDGAKLVSAVLRDTSFVETSGDGANLVSANLEGARLVMNTSFAGADFRGAKFLRTCLRTTNLAGADFSGAHAPEVDFSECDLTGAKFYRAMMDNSLFVRADLTGASLVSATLKMSILQKAKLFGADLRGANLFRCDLAKVKLDKQTKLDDALLTQVRIVHDTSKPEGAS